MGNAGNEDARHAKFMAKRGNKAKTAMAPYVRNSLGPGALMATTGPYFRYCDTL